MARLALPRRRALSLLLAALLALPLVAAPGEAATKKRVTVSGVLRWADGTPAARQHVQLTRVTGLGDAIGALFFFAFTGGFAAALCFDDEASEALVQCGNNTLATRTDAAGRYTFAFASEVIDSPDRKFTVTARVPRSAARAPGAQVVVTSRLRVGRNAMPALSFWQPRVTGPVSSLSWTDLAAAKSYGQTFASRTGLRQDAGGGPPVELDPRLLEDTRGTVTLTAYGGTVAQPVVWTAPRTAYAGTAGAPVSRRRPCRVTVETVAGQRPAAGCWLTDARHARPFPGSRPKRCFLDPDFVDPVFGERRRFCEYANVTSAEVDLGRVVDVDAIITRGECDTCQVETSVDRVVWEHPDSGTGPGHLADWEGRPARWVRVMADPHRSPVNRTLAEVPRAKLGGRRLPVEAPGDLSGLTELSVWELNPAPPLEPAPRTPDGPRPAAGPAAPADEPTPLAVVVALVLLVASALGVGHAGWSRRTLSG